MIRALRTPRATWGLLVPLVARCAAGATLDAVRRMDDALLPLDDDDLDVRALDDHPEVARPAAAHCAA
jgi:hypothetical protein